jgi:hypothetical protein
MGARTRQECIPSVVTQKVVKVEKDVSDPLGRTGLKG